MMSKPLRGWKWAWPAIALAAGAAALALWQVWPLRHAAENTGLEKTGPPLFEPTPGPEPITPIPLELKLDARRVELGRRLFFDTRFSRDNTISCAHCHDLAHGGMDGQAVATGIEGRRGRINTLTVFNSGFNFRLFWDGRAATLEKQMDDPIRSPDEMGTTMPEVVEKLKQDSSYRRDFAETYHDEIRPDYVRDAIATFERSLITPNARFDRWLRGDANALTEEELSGYQLFKKLGCISCHQGMNVGGNMFEKLGLVGNYFQARGNVQQVDFGLYNYTHKEEDRYEFRVPSLRNVALTAPYFHDASADTLEKAVATMAKYQLGVTLPDADIAKIVKFLNTLTGVYAGKTGP